MTISRVPACSVSFCPAKRDPDWHSCWCGGLEIEHHHVESRGMGGSKIKRHVVALCHAHHEAVTLHECYDIVTDFDWGKTYTYIGAKGEVLHERTLEAGSAAAEAESESMGPSTDSGFESRSSPSAAAPPVSGDSGAADRATLEPQKPNIESRLVGTVNPSAAPPSLEAWCQEGMGLVYCGLALRDGADSLRFAIGDWFNQGEAWMPNEVYGYLRGFEDVTVRQYSWVAGRVAADTRVSKLDWTYHRTVAALPPGEQKEWLKRAQEENLSTKAFGRAIHGEKARVRRYTFDELEGHLCHVCREVLSLMEAK